MSEMEYCFDCDGPTGNAGRGEGSIYIELPSGAEVGPLCDKCRGRYDHPTPIVTRESNERFYLNCHGIITYIHDRRFDPPIKDVLDALNAHDASKGNELAIECLREIMRSHRDPNSDIYNECDEPGEECLWCANAEKAIASLVPVDASKVVVNEKSVKVALHWLGKASSNLDNPGAADSVEILVAIHDLTVLLKDKD